MRGPHRRASPLLVAAALCVAQGAKSPAACRDRFEAPDQEGRATDLNGVRLPDVCINSTGEHEVFVIGDWGGHWTGGDGDQERLKPADNRVDGIHKRDFVRGLDDFAQHRVRDQMLKRAAEVDLEYVLNVGDNFYWAGVERECGQSRGAANFSTQWDTIFEGVYSGPGLDGKQWLGVLGNHDWGGYAFNQGWDQAIMYTWRRPSTGGLSRWVTPALYWRARVRYPDFSVDYFFMDSNIFDANDTWHNVNHNICGYAHNPVNASCSSEGGPTGILSCPSWFHQLWAEQQEWLKWGVMGSTAEWQVVVTHFPPCFGRDFWERISADYGVDLIISGHLHRQEVHYDEPDNFLWPTAWLVSGGGGGITSDFMPDMDGDDQYGFMHLTLSKDNIRVRNIAHNGEIRTQVQIAKRPCVKCYGYDHSKLRPQSAPAPASTSRPAHVDGGDAPAAASKTSSSTTERKSQRGAQASTEREAPATVRSEVVAPWSGAAARMPGALPCTDVSASRWLDPSAGAAAPCPGHSEPAPGFPIRQL